jgi:symplekin
MVAIKSRILRIWDTAAAGVRICCIKFAQRVVLVQTVGPEADSKVWMSHCSKHARTDVIYSVANLSRFRSLWYLRITPSYLPETSKPKPRVFSTECWAFSRRALGSWTSFLSFYYSTNFYSDAVLVDATLNSLSILIRARPHIANKILNVILNFNPLKQANSPMTPKLRVMVKSMERTTRSLLIHISKRYA